MMYNNILKSYEKHTKCLSAFRIDFWLVLILSIAFFPIAGVNTSPDSAWYLSNALNIFNGYGYVDTDQLTPIISRGRPVFPFLISLSFWLFGVSIHSAMLVIRLFFVLNNLIVYKLGKDLFDWKVGFLAAMLCLFSSTIHELSSHLIFDNVWPFFILLSLWLMFKACSRGKIIWFILAGLSLSVSFMIKEVSVLWLPLPLIYVLVFQLRRWRQNFLGIMMLYLAFFLCVTPWAIRNYENIGFFKRYKNFSPLAAQGPGPPKGIFRECSEQGREAVFCKIRMLYRGIFDFYEKYITEKFAIPGILILISYALIFFRASLYRNGSDGLLAMSLLCLLPLAFALGIVKFRIGQAFILYLLSALVVAESAIVFLRFGFFKAGGAFKRLRGKEGFLTTVSTIVVVCVVVLYHLFGNNPCSRQMLNILKEKPASAVSFLGLEHFFVGRWHDASMKNLGDWITENIPGNATIMCEWYKMRSIYFFSNGRNKMCSIPIRQSGRKYPMGQHETVSKKNRELYRVKCERMPLFLWSNYDQVSPKYGLFAFCECDILDRIRSEKVDYVIVTKRRNFLSLYFDKNPCFRKIHETNQGENKIYQVFCAKPVSGFEMMIGSRLVDYLKAVEKEKPRKYDFLMNHFLPNRLGLSKAAIQGIFDGAYPHITKLAIYGGKDDSASVE